MVKEEPKSAPHYEWLVGRKVTGHPAVSDFLGKWQLKPDAEHNMVDIRMVASAMESLLKFMPSETKKDVAKELESKVEVLTRALQEIIGDKEDEYSLMGNEMPAEMKVMIEVAKRALEEVSDETK